MSIKPEGVAFGTPAFSTTVGAVLPWAGRVRSVRPSPQGLAVEVQADELLVTLRVPPPVTAPLPALGERVRFGIDPATLQPLGSGSHPAGGG